MAKVSVIIPIYNTEQYLPRCMDTVLNQTLKDIEIILVDDQSPDNCPQMCDEYAKQDPRVKVIHKINGGLGYARNSGMKIASGEYVAFLDSDDYVSLDMYEKLYCSAKDNDSDTCFCDFSLDRDGKIIPIICPIDSETVNGNTKIVENILFNVLGASLECKSDNALGMSVWRGIYSLKLIKEYNIEFCSERDYICEDAIFHIDYFSKSRRFSYVKEPMYFYCLAGTSLSRVYREDRFEKNKIFFLEEKRRLSNIGLEDKACIYIERMFLALIRGNMTDAVRHKKYKEAVNVIDCIVNDKVVYEVISSYPYQKNPSKQRFFNEAVAKKKILTIYIMLKAAVIYRNFKND